MCEKSSSCEHRDENTLQCSQFSKSVSDEIVIGYGCSSWEVACILISSVHLYEDMWKQPKQVPFFEPEELLRIGQHLVGFYNTEYGKGSETP